MTITSRTWIPYTMKYTTIIHQPSIYNVYHQKISSSFPYLQSVLSVHHLNKYRALRSTCRLSASFVFKANRASKLASCLRAELLNETTTSCLSACSIEVKESKTHSSHAHLRFWKNFMTCCNGVLWMAASS